MTDWRGGVGQWGWRFKICYYGLDLECHNLDNGYITETMLIQWEGNQNTNF